CARPRPRYPAPSTAQIRCGHWRAHSRSAGQAAGVFARVRSPTTALSEIATAWCSFLCASTPIQITAVLLREAQLAAGADDRRVSRGSDERLRAYESVRPATTP